MVALDGGVGGPVQKPFHAIDINLNKAESTGIAYYRMPDDMVKFISKCMEGKTVIGFAWEGTPNLGIILGPVKKVPTEKKQTK